MKIKFIKKVTFRDNTGAIVREYNIGDVIEATSEDTHRNYYNTSMGGIFFDEAEQWLDPSLVGK